MRAVWRGAVSFGLVSVPVRAYTATAPREVRFHQVHAADGGRIRYRKVCDVDGQEVATDAIAKAYDTGDGLVVLSDDDLAALPLASGREIEVVEFVPADQVDPVLHDSTYYLEPDQTAAKPYALLREALAATERVAVATVALRQRESLALLRVRGDVICLQTLLWPAEVREPDVDTHAGAAGELKAKEKAVAAQLVASLSADFDPSAYSDRYAEAVRALVTEKVERGDVRRPAEGSAGSGAAGGSGGGEVVDLLAALQRSVERAEGKAPATATAPARTRTRAAAPAKTAASTRARAAAPAKTAATTRARAAAPAKTAAKAPARSKGAAAAEGAAAAGSSRATRTRKGA